MTYRHGGAVFADTSVQDDVEVVMARVDSPSDDANDGEGVQLQSEDRQLWKQFKLTKNFPPLRKKTYVKAASMLSVMGGRSEKKKSE